MPEVLVQNVRRAQRGPRRSRDYAARTPFQIAGIVLSFETEPAKGELSFANTADHLDSGDGGCCAPKVFEAEHRSSSGFDTAVILLDQVVQIL